MRVCCKIHSTHIQSGMESFLFLFFCYCSRKFVSVELMIVNKLDFEPIRGSFCSSNIKGSRSPCRKLFERRETRSRLFFSPQEILKGYFSALAYDVYVVSSGYKSRLSRDLAYEQARCAMLHTRDAAPQRSRFVCDTPACPGGCRSYLQAQYIVRSQIKQIRASI